MGRKVSRGQQAPRKTETREGAWGRFGRAVQGQIIPWLFLMPALLVFATFSWYPIILGAVVSFQEYHPLRPPRWVGFENFQTLFSDPLFATAWGNTAKFALLALLFGYMVPVILALAINEVRRFSAFFRAAYYLPAILPGVVTAVLWQWMYDPGAGLINSVIRLFGGRGLPWLLSAETVIPSLVIMATWAGAGATMVVYLAALRGIPVELYEAAEIDGASVVQRIRYISVPQVLPVMLTMLILQIVGTIQVFTEPYVMTGGGPNNASITVMLLIYRYAFRYFEFGVASAAGLILFLVLLAITIVYLWVTRRVQND